MIEISPGWNRYWRALCPDYRSVDFPKFDICKDRTDEQYSIVIADQVLEHVQCPHAAAANIHAMTKPGGWAMVATPFLFRVHGRSRRPVSRACLSTFVAAASPTV
nr:methyltransferase domain-containing protein [Mesorhizobium sp. SARCC-RB16n]